MDGWMDGAAALEGQDGAAVPQAATIQVPSKLPMLERLKSEPPSHWGPLGCVLHSDNIQCCPHPIHRAFGRTWSHSNRVCIQYPSDISHTSISALSHQCPCHSLLAHQTTLKPRPQTSQDMGSYPSAGTPGHLLLQRSLSGTPIRTKHPKASRTAIVTDGSKSGTGTDP